LRFSTTHNTLPWLLASLMFAAAALAVAASARASTQVTQAASPPPVPTTGAYFGARAAPTSGQTEITAINSLEQLVGRKFAIDHYYEAIGDTLPSKPMIASANAGRYPLVDLDTDTAWTWPKIASGAADSALISQAKGLAAWGKPCFINFDHEPEAYGGSHGTAADFVAAWRHVVGIFRNQGATNCSWVWILEAQTFGQAAAASSWYPGDQYVDWLAADGYDWYPGKSGSTWREFASIFGSLHSWAAGYHAGKPVMVAETGVQEDPANPTRKAGWFTNALATMKSWPQFKAFVYYNSPKIYPWLVNSSSASLAAFRTIGANSYFNP
jgi:hypothetical protein